MPRRRAAFSASTLFVVVLVVLVVVFLFCIFFHDDGAVFVFFFFFGVVIFVGELELDRRIHGYTQERSALRACHFVADINVVLIYVNRRIALGTNRGHARRSLAAV